VFRQNVVLVGDAAGFFDGITGEGMGLALVGARLAATRIREHLASGEIEPFRRYDRERRALARNSELLGRLTLFTGPKAAPARWSTRNLARRPATFDRLAAVGAGELPMRGLRPRDLVALTLGL
jgi:flavin-dependent dehydrogenase